MTMFNMISLLKNPDEIQAAIRQETLPVSQGYVFAANLDCPDLMKAVNSGKTVKRYVPPLSGLNRT
jgi:hypothetical protein